MADYFKQSNDTTDNTNRPRIDARKQGVEVPTLDFRNKNMGGKSKRIFKRNVKNKKKSKKKLN